ncbi:hypothetical protein T265_05903 [Opisthorchis viverrini]|uniref:Elongator complex protein 2 n=1 Tax=Opisthorchis viverrini TaxID=6198 RepID=A0A074ZU40_OPIVI|nr:hypothetical protein T265_05903 [Opisthorchis viverrini]KER26915.1 hypothetical protein T265_05903 [Opisthorchis viverrini]
MGGNSNGFGEINYVRKPRHNFGRVISFEDPTPEAPHPQAVERLMAHYPDQHKVLFELDKLFKGRPIWLRNAIAKSVTTNLRSALYKGAIICFAYYMVRGPWSRSWIRYGYDPRTDPEARFYQVIDFRIKSHVLIRQILERNIRYSSMSSNKTRRGRLNWRRPDGSLHWLSDAPQTQTKNQSSTSLKSDAEVDMEGDLEMDYANEMAEDAVDVESGSLHVGYSFSRDHLPTAQQMLICLSDIDIPEVQAIVAEKPERTPTCPMNSSVSPKTNDANSCCSSELTDLILCPYTSACVNRRSGCTHAVSIDAHHKVSGNLLAFGASHAICLARTIEAGRRECDDGFRILRMLLGHNSPVTCLRWMTHVSKDFPVPYLVLASADNTGNIKIWACKKESVITEPWCSAAGDWSLILEVSLPGSLSANALDGLIAHSSSCTEGYQGIDDVLILDVAADTSMYTWHIGLHRTQEISPVVLSHRATNRFPSMCLCLRTCLWMHPSVKPIHFVFVGLDSGKTEIYSEYLTETQKETFDQLTCSAVLSGHTDWVRCLDATQNSFECTTSLYLATGSQDNVIRLWNIFQSSPVIDISKHSSGAKICDLNLPSEGKPAEFTLSIASESVLSGHDNWVTGVAWSPEDSRFPPPLLSSSMDKSLIVWSPPQSTGGNVHIWLEGARLGNLGGAGMGFMDGFWLLSDPSTICAQNFQGSLSVWHFSADKSFWSPGLPICGHSGSVTDIAWSKKKVSDKCLIEKNRSVTPTYLLTTGSDQTVRVHTPRRLSVATGDVSQLTGDKAKEGWVWHELARPQVHGYDMNAICSLSTIGYVSAGDEKVARVFTATRAFVESYQDAIGLEGYSLADCYISEQPVEALAEGAIQPTLGLSNQMTGSESGSVSFNGAEVDSTIPTEHGDAPLHIGAISIPTEDRLQHATLWPETKKLYGHPYEVYSLAAHPNRRLVASACVASKQIHAYIILWNGMSDWTIHQRLVHHQLTVTQMAWSLDGRHLLAVSRDRTWSVWSCDGTPVTDAALPNYCLTAYPQKGHGHSRIIWTCAWSPDNDYFVSGSRDQTILVWPTPDASSSIEPAPKAQRPLIAPKLFAAAVTALDICRLSDHHTSSDRHSHLVAVGLETGSLLLLTLSSNRFSQVSGSNLPEWSALIQIPAFWSHVSGSNLPEWSALIQIPKFWSHVPGKHIRRVAFEPSSNSFAGESESNSILFASGADDGIVHIFEIDGDKLIMRISQSSPQQSNPQSV